MSNDGSIVIVNYGKFVTIGMVVIVLIATIFVDCIELIWYSIYVAEQIVLFNLSAYIWNVCVGSPRT